MNIESAKTIPLALILEKIGFQPVRTRKGEAVYSSPLRNEKTPSFHVSLTKNAWYDFGEGAGGNSVDFVLAFLTSQREASTVHDALRWLTNMTGDVSMLSSYTPPVATESPPSLTVKKKSRIQHRALLGYLVKRGIPSAMASPYLVELTVLNADSGKQFFALGMRNEEDGYELRNPFFKGCAGHKGISFIRGTEPKQTGFHLFEGMFDFVSVLASKNIQRLPEDAIILHSLSCLKQALPYITGYGYHTAFTWLDNDSAGVKATLALKELFTTEHGLQHQLMNKLYQPYKDVNAWHTRSPSLPSLSL